MNGQSNKQRMLEAIEELGGMDVVMERIASCESLTSIAGSLGASPKTLGHYLNKDPRLRRAVRLARESAVKVLVEEALSIGRRATRLAEAAARLQAHGRVWLAARHHTGRVGRKAQGQRTSHSAMRDVTRLRRKDAGRRGTLRGSPATSGKLDQFVVTAEVARTSHDTALNLQSEETGRN